MSNCCLSTVVTPDLHHYHQIPLGVLCANRAMKGSTHFIFFQIFEIWHKVGETCSSDAVLNTKFS